MNKKGQKYENVGRQETNYEIDYKRLHKKIKHTQEIRHTSRDKK